ncbi:MAG: hypothetical protein H7A23_09350 [Leptospiraceae bacterium]|nr:hypothetical protein [Leptospiraceae bacterium]MCP5494749.1 hypothetical protein [Leptospiraceae bacterium]
MKEAVVAEIINDNKIVINAGEKDGLKKGMEVLVYAKGNEIFDPLTNESLGILEIVKGTGTITHLQNRIATVESNMKLDTSRKLVTKKKHNESALFQMVEMLQPYRVIEEIEEIPSKVMVPFENLEVGDLVKIIRK